MKLDALLDWLRTVPLPETFQLERGHVVVDSEVFRTALLHDLQKTGRLQRAALFRLEKLILLMDQESFRQTYGGLYKRMIEAHGSQVNARVVVRAEGSVRSTSRPAHQQGG